MKFKRLVKTITAVILTVLVSGQVLFDAQEVHAATISLYTGEKCTNTKKTKSTSTKYYTYYSSYPASYSYYRTVKTTTTYANEVTYYAKSMKVVSKVNVKTKKYTYTRGSRKYKLKVTSVTTKTTKTYSLPSKEITVGTYTGTKLPAWLVNDFYAQGGHFYLDPDLSHIFSTKPKSSVIGSTLWSSRGTKIAIRRRYNKSGDTTVYHEMGHYLDFTAQYLGCNYHSDKSSFRSIYYAEKNKYPGNNKSYYTKDTCEYFAQCYAEYLLNGDRLKRYCPKTYNYIANASSALKNKVNDKPKVKQYTTTYYPNKTYYVGFENLNGKQFTSWKSSDESIVEVSSDGHYLLTKDVGTATITGTYTGGRSISYKIEVDVPPGEEVKWQVIDLTQEGS